MLIQNTMRLGKHLFLFIAVLVIPVITIAQNDSAKFPVAISIFNNSTVMPGSGYLGIFKTPVHPGITFGTHFRLNKSEKNRLFETLKLGYFYHHYAQHGIHLLTEFSYRHFCTSGFGAGLSIGVGYLYSIPDVGNYTLNDGGKYESKSFTGRSQVMPSATLELSYEIKRENRLPVRFFLGYQFWFQLPFVNEYVPILPNTALHIGTVFYLKTRKK